MMRLARPFGVVDSCVDLATPIQGLQMRWLKSLHSAKQLFENQAPYLRGSMCFYSEVGMVCCKGESHTGAILNLYYAMA